MKKYFIAICNLGDTHPLYHKIYDKQNVPVLEGEPVFKHLQRNTKILK